MSGVREPHLFDVSASSYFHYIYYIRLHKSSMPIDIERFEDDPSEELQAGGRTNAETILTFLASSPEKAFTPKEIHDATAVARGSVGVVLSRLDERGLVRHRGDYWAIDPDADIDKTLSGMATARVVTEDLGAEDPDEWGPGVDSDSEDETSE